MSLSRIGRYTPLTQALHWITAVMMLAIVILAWVFMSEPAQTADRFTYIDNSIRNRVIFDLVTL